MNTVKFDKGSTQMVAHRGVSGIERENTNAAFLAAGNRSYYGIETDTYRTTDGKYVCFHDNTTARVAGTDVCIPESNYETLCGVTLLSMDGTHSRRDLVIPTLEEYISICKTYEKVAVLELKQDFNKDEVEEILAIIRKADYLEHTTFISFHKDPLLIIRDRLPEQNIQFLTSTFTDDLIPFLVNQTLDIDIRHTELTKERIDAFHAAHIKVNAWTVDAPARGEELAAWGIDYITSNILE